MANIHFSGAGASHALGRVHAGAPVAMVVDGFSTYFREIVLAVRRTHEYRRTVRELRKLDDRALHDIGLHRREIEVTAYALAVRHAKARPHRYRRNF